MVKMDESLNCSAREAGSGYVIRNGPRSFMEAAYRLHSFVVDPLVSELLTSREAYMMFLYWGSRRLSSKLIATI
jgi:hypothetical protein